MKLNFSFESLQDAAGFVEACAKDNIAAQGPRPDVRNGAHVVECRFDATNNRLLKHVTSRHGWVRITRTWA